MSHLDYCEKSYNTRGIRLRIDKNGVKIYEVANGSYRMTLKWSAQGKECHMIIDLHDNGRVELVEGNGVTPEQLAANNVRVGRQYEAKPLHEALWSQLQQENSELQQENSETVTILQPPSTNVTGPGARNLAEERARERSSNIYVR